MTYTDRIGHVVGCRAQLDHIYVVDLGGVHASIDGMLIYMPENAQMSTLCDGKHSTIDTQWRIHNFVVLGCIV